MSALALRCRSLEVRWRGKLVLGPMDLDVESGERVALHGGSGTGKSALLQAIVRRDDYDQDLEVRGTLDVGGRNILRENRLHAYRQRVGMVPQFPSMLPGSVYDNVAFAPLMRGVRAPADLNAIVEQALRTAAVWDAVKDRLAQSPKHFSAGQQQRITIARAIAQRPGLLLLDQPFTLLDAATARQLEATLWELPDTTVVLATPDERRAARFAARVIELQSRPAPGESLHG